ncbi:hypothetical protein PUNSTDRAFT_52022 [Punctularia strigosozonata HHB-11173 SS5]|uniref:uncharacterized protein n=1 Tax=Punctularia strigosozonata (strain HHB-11173) TaxID=741275 RepID=UPI0004417B3D|nr:uncharacterized protein PUNSTDRAFT_52022 [Punctularia strigosozonata HHB-11173 SS5]EIN09838.1 hypothetical protein PUNSTDRAFT_52022 [Punctularia strigosozonata HHB-11173 SS5]
MADAPPGPQTDVSRPSALPTARLIGQRARENQALVDQSSDEYLNAIEEDWNKKIDADVEALVDGMTDLVGLASIGTKDKFRIAQESFQAQCRAESMVRAANSLLSTVHSMKLLLLISDEAQIANKRDAELRSVRAESDAARKEAAQLLDELLKGTTPSSANDEPETTPDTPAVTHDEHGIDTQKDDTGTKDSFQSRA